MNDLSFDDLKEAGFEPVSNIKLGVTYPPILFKHNGWIADNGKPPEVHVEFEPWLGKIGAMQPKIRNKEELGKFVANIPKFCDPK